MKYFVFRLMWRKYNYMQMPAEKLHYFCGYDDKSYEGGDLRDADCIVTLIF